MHLSTHQSCAPSPPPFWMKPLGFLLLLKPHAKILSSHMVEPGREAPDVIIDIRRQKQNKTVVSASFVLKEWGTRPQLLACQLSPLTMAALCFKLAFKVEQVYIVITANRVANSGSSKINWQEGMTFKKVVLVIWLLLLFSPAAPSPVSSITVNTTPELQASKGDAVRLSCTFISSSTPTSKMSVDWSYRPHTGGPSHTVSSHLPGFQHFYTLTLLHWFLPHVIGIQTQSAWDARADTFCAEPTIKAEFG